MAGSTLTIDLKDSVESVNLLAETLGKLSNTADSVSGRMQTLESMMVQTIGNIESRMAEQVSTEQKEILNKLKAEIETEADMEMGAVNWEKWKARDQMESLRIHAPHEAARDDLDAQINGYNKQFEASPDAQEIIRSWGAIKLGILEASDAFFTFDKGMADVKEGFKKLEDTLATALKKDGTIYDAIYNGGSLDQLWADLGGQLKIFAGQKSAHLLMEAAYETVLGTAALFNPARAGSAAGHFAAAGKYAAGAGLMGTFALVGKAHDGMDDIPKEGTWLLDKGERIVDARTNKDLKSFLTEKTGSSPVINITIHGGDKESIMSALPELERTIINAVSGNIIQGGAVKRAIVDYTR